MPEAGRSVLIRYGSMVAAVLLATVVRALLDRWLDDKLLFSTYYIAVMFAAWCTPGSSSPA